jgi:FixJ family two-component response regulator
MPMISGYDVVEILRAYGITTPIVILSTASNALLINRVFNAGANFFITKPTSLNLLKAAVKHALNIDWNNFTPTIKEFSHKL